MATVRPIPPLKGTGRCLKAGCPEMFGPGEAASADRWSSAHTRATGHATVVECANPALTLITRRTPQDREDR